ncbi:MAG: ArsO family NAD(P)H-dependent flavin-containing monooxygenase [Bacteroidota bacterium]
MQRSFDVIVIGGGQSGLAVGYYLRRTGLSFIILDKAERAGGSWQNYWKSLRLFSPAQWSSLPGVIMSGGSNYYPTREETISYLRDYEQKYQLPVKRSVSVESVTKSESGFQLQTSDGGYETKVVISATGSFENPFIPQFEGMESFQGEALHSSRYFSPEDYQGKRVAVVGEGNSGAQILAEVSSVAETIWITRKEPRFLADDIDGRYLFDAATQMYEAKKQGKEYQPPSLGDIVMVPPVKEARERGVFRKTLRPFLRFTKSGLEWEDGNQEKVDVVIFCTGFKSSLIHLSDLDIVSIEGRADTLGTKSKAISGLWFVGYGNWTGFASATLIGVGRSAKQTVEEIKDFIR